MKRMSVDSYANLPNKSLTGRPLQYWVQMKENKNVNAAAPLHQSSTITLWPVPNSSTKYKLLYYRHRRIADAGDEGGYTLDIHATFLPALTAELAYQLAKKSQRPDIVVKAPALKEEARQLWEEATQNDRERADMRVVPRYYRV